MTILTPDQAGGILLGILFITTIGTGAAIDWIHANKTRILAHLRRTLRRGTAMPGTITDRTIIR